ncbi:MAG: exodeoxyribonuclease VII large subunit [Holosporales bacterium]|nr:exodeoxyribonuclease VII large subunit [Holosporales bacterium]
MSSSLNNKEEDPPTEHIFSVSELAFSLKKVVETTFSTLCVQGEVSGLHYHSSGHLYFSLKDPQAVLDAVFWKGAIRTKHLPLEEGMEIRCWAHLTTYPARSRYQIVVDHYTLAGQGALLKIIEERKQRLAREGLFSAQHKKALPFLPRQIGVITSPTGAVLRDILHRLMDRFPVPVVLWPVLVQGEGAAAQVAAAVRGFQTFPQQARPDVLIVARGGGSVEDLLPFNEEIVVRAVFESKIPVISAIGHETDTTLIDYVADVRAPTPTAAAELVVPVRRVLQSSLFTLFHQLGQALQRCSEGKQHRLRACTLPPAWRIMGLRSQELDRLTDRMMAQIRRILEQKRAMALPIFSRRLASWAPLLVHQQQIEQLDQRQKQAIRVFWEARQAVWSRAAELLEGASFQRLLERGFSLVQGAGGHLISSAIAARQEPALAIVFHDGICSVAPLKGNA